MSERFSFVSPAYAVEFDSFKDSMNKAFNDEISSPSNIINLFILLFFITVGVFVFRYVLKKEEERLAERRFSGFKLEKSSAQRKFFRTPVKIDIVWSPIVEVKGKEIRYCSEVINISGGGLCFRTEAVLNPEDLININLEIGEDDPLVIPSKVIRAVKVPNQEAEETAEANEDIYEVAVNFNKMPRSQEDKVVKYVMGYERDRIKNNKLDIIRKSQKEKFPEADVDENEVEEESGDYSFDEPGEIEEETESIQSPSLEQNPPDKINNE
ncbi:MAG: PilZ domain-containing protein [Peptococcaceae bacterium]|nr:PilZ domain-containing protein [Peptococcaceae bacterium]